MNCGNCGANLTNEDTFCPNCGAKLIKEEPNSKKKYSIAKAFLMGFILSIVVFLVPAFVNIICGLGHVEMNGTFRIILSVIQYVCPIIVLFTVPIILYIVKNK